MSHFLGKVSGASGRGISLCVGGGMFRQAEFLPAKKIQGAWQNQERAEGIQAGAQGHAEGRAGFAAAWCLECGGEVQDQVGGQPSLMHSCNSVPTKSGEALPLQPWRRVAAAGYLQDRHV
jgi:hypothetical protein